ncbi:MAG: Rrf2 family transcriptional regulator [Thermoleophilia bacterium]
MTSLSAKSEYAIKALVCLALAPTEEPVLGREIVAFADVPPKYLDQVMHDLRRSGFVESRRGARGGYVLLRDPASITFLEVAETIDGSCGGKGRMRPHDQAEVLVAPVWDELEECRRTILQTATIARAAARAVVEPMYHI